MIMDNKINIAELLKDCPSGMELDCTMYENLYFDSLNADYYGTINCYTLIDGIKTSINFTKYGTFNNHLGAKCVIFPKGKTTWEGFVPSIQFKDGDMIQDVDKYKVKITEVRLEDECYGYESMIAKGIGAIPFKEQNNWELVPNKFDITTLKVFDKVLVRDSNESMWSASIFSHTWKDKYICIGIWYNQCIPYEGNEHLLGTTDDCDDFYKTWG